MMQLRVGAFPTVRRLSTISTLPPRTIRNIARYATTRLRNR